MVYLYCDEGGKSRNCSWISLCGYKIPARRIALFYDQWGTRVDYWGIPPVHMSEIFHSDRKSSAWRKVKDQKGDNWNKWITQILNNLASLIAQQSEVGQSSSPPISSFGVVLNVDYFSQFCPKLKERFGNDPIYLAFHRIVTKYVEQASRNQHDPAIGIVVDEDKDTSLQFHKIVNDIRHDTSSDVGRAIRSLCFVDDRTYPLIQAADMLAYASRQRQLDLTDSSFPALPTSIYEKLTAGFTFEPEVLGIEELKRLEEGQR